VPGTTMRLLARLLEQAMGEEPAPTPISSGPLPSCGPHGSVTPSGWACGIDAARTLQTHLDELSLERRAELTHQAAMLCGLLAEAQPERPAPPAPLASGLLSLLSANAHTICDGELSPLGVGLFPSAALTNHDCEPSAVQSFEGSTLVLRATRPIAVGAPVTIGYVELCQSPAARQAELRSGYFFTCACRRCVREAPREAELSEMSDRLVATRAATLAAIDEQRWADALVSAARSCELCEQLAPDGAPSLGLERLRLAKLLAHAGRVDDAIDQIRSARGVLIRTHGADAPLVRSLDEQAYALAAERAEARSAAN
jgi:hypothetical protein